VAKTNEQRIHDLQTLKFPIIENLILLKEDADQLREALTNAIILENNFLVEDALEAAPVFDNRVADISRLIGQPDTRLDEIRENFARYKVLGTTLAEALTGDEINLAVFTQSAAKTSEAFKQLNTSINRMLYERQEDYANDLAQINKDINLTNIVAALVGLAFVIGLIMLTMFITRKVILAIEKADKLKEIFLSTISHELRTPMNGIIGALSLLKRSAIDAEQQELVDIANQSSSAMIKTVDDILTFTELMSGTPKLAITSFNEQEWLGDLLKIAKRRCAEKHLTLDFKSDLNNKLLVNDKNKLTHVCRNLLENAVKYSTGGTISFTVTHSQDEADNQPGTLSIRIEDNGPGLGSEFLDHIFKPFSQAEGGFNRSYQGMGIGLAMSNIIVNHLGGKLVLRNRDDQVGTIAEFTIPSRFHAALVMPAVKPILTANPATQTVSGAHSMSATQSMSAINASMDHVPQILIVEDNKVNQMVLSKLVRQLNCITLLANNGEEGLKQVQNNPIDLILMDCQMPVMDGFEATERIRKLTAPKNRIPIVAVTANARDEDKNRCFDVGMDGFLSKPVDFRSVRQAILEQLAKQKAETAAQKAKVIAS
jgi:signal transduction histidine kinase/ActR/RegA family two-component response regulator